MWPSVRDQRVFVAALAGVVALAWLSLWTLGRSPYAQLAHNHGAGGAGAWTVYLSLAGWTAMVVAMMLPTTFPLVALFHSFVRSRPNRARLTTLLVAGYLWIWTLIGFVVYAGNHAVRAAVHESGWLTANVWLIGAAAVLLAGLYQFTALSTSAWRSAARRSASLWSTGGAGAGNGRRSTSASITECSASVAAGP